MWLCNHLPTSKPVAVKVLTEQMAIGRALIEVDALTALAGNTNILQLVETVAENDRMYIVTDFVDGGDILKYMQDRGCRPLAEEEARRLFRELVFALDAVHRSGWVHRDIKCENVLLSAARDRVIIADFGFAGKWSPYSQLNEPFGSLHYSSPEIVTARPYFGPEVDVWSLGVVLYALCFGRLPFGGESEDEIADRIVAGNYPMPTGASTDLYILLAMMLHPNAAARAKLDAVKRSNWLMSGVDTAVAAPPVVLRSKTTGSAIGGRNIASRPRRSSMSSLAEGLFRHRTQAKLDEADGTAEGVAHQPPLKPQTTNPEVAVAAPATTGECADSGMLTRLSRFTANGVKRFSLTRLFKGRTSWTN